jgi:hypothetical protein
VEEYEYRWDREFAITRVGQSVLGWAAIFGIPSAIVWLATLNTPGREAQVVAGYLGLTAVCAALHSRKYWKRLSNREPQLELRRDGIRAAQLGGKHIPWREVVQLRGVEESIHRDISSLTVDTTAGSITLNIAGLDAPMRTIINQAETVALASRSHDSA